MPAKLQEYPRTDQWLHIVGFTDAVSKVKSPWDFHSFIHSGYFYSASSSPLIRSGVPNYSIDTVSKLTR